ncbi:MAG: Fe-S cluster domain-containing protein, partial [Pseudomonadota bacterium]
MENVWFTAGMGLAFFVIFGVLCGIALAYAAKRFAVKVDPKIEAVRAALPGANCGACGFAGCDSYAEAVATEAAVAVNKCAPGKGAVADKIAEITGKVALAAGEVISVLRCSRNEGDVKKKHAYVGFDTCAAAAIAFGGPWECNFACIGLGDCEAACPFHAIHMKDGMPHIDPNECTGCGVCIKMCPKAVLQLMPKSAPVYVPCSTKDKGKDVTSVCKAGCIHCLACTRKGGEAVELVNGRIEVDYGKLTDEGAKGGVWACSRQFIFRYCDPDKQAAAVKEIK